MFKKIEAVIGDLKVLIRTSLHEHLEQHNETRKTIVKECLGVSSKLNQMNGVISSQQRTIEQLTNALHDKYKHGLFVLSDDGSNFMLIKNGEKITNEKLSFCRVTWSPGEAVSVETEYIV